MRTAKVEGTRLAGEAGLRRGWRAIGRPGWLFPSPRAHRALAAAPARRQVARDDLKKRISDRCYRLSRLRRQQHRSQRRAPRASGLWPDRPQPRSSRHRHCAAMRRERRSISSPACSRMSHPTLPPSCTISAPSSACRSRKSECSKRSSTSRCARRGSSFGHSIGELSALVLGGVYAMEQLLPVPLSLATDCAELTANTTWESCRCTERRFRSKTSSISVRRSAAGVMG